MKKVDTVLVYLLIYFLLLSVFPLIGVLSDSSNSNESSLDIQSTILITNNISANAEQEAALTSESGNIVSSSETQSNEVADLLTQTDKLGEVPESVFSEVITQNSGVANEIINNDTPTVIPHIDSATEELQERAANFASSLISQDNLNEDVAREETNITIPSTKVEEDRSDLNTTTFETDEKLMPKNLTDKNAEDIPSFSEWAQKHLEEVEKKEQANFSTPSQTINTTKQGSGAKLRWKNYASVDCGAKVILANSEAQNTWAILSPSRDEYKLNPCNSRIWFIVELCEAIQVKKIDLANYELFSSSPKDFAVSVSDRFPTRDWSTVGQFTAKDERDVQNFDVNTDTFGKYIKVEIKSHYGSEHYCPLSLFRAYGTSVFEVLQKDDPAHEQPIEDDDDDDETLDHTFKGDTSGNLLSSATDAVLSMVKNVAEVLGSKVNKTKESSQTSNEAKSHAPIIKSCSSPSHYVVCNNCSDMLFGQIFELLSCTPKQTNNLVSIPFISKALVNSMICERFGFDFKSKAAKTTANSCPKCIESFFPPRYLGAMCNALAISFNKVLYNISHQYANTTENISADNLISVENQESKVIPVIETEPKNILDEPIEHRPTEPLIIEYPEINTKSSCSTDSTYASHIKPSRSFATDLPVQSELNTAPVNIENPSQHTDNFEQQRVLEVPTVEPTVVETITEMPQESEVATESSVEENIDKLITELNSEASPSVISAPTSASNLQGQKESVFLRLSNRIKALERNMSLSGQYLEELSKRYKKQVEEMQRVLEKTEQTLNDVTSKQEERHKQLEDRLESLTNAVETLLAERNSWKNTSYWLFFVVALMFLVYCFNRYSTSKPETTDNTKPVEIQRRNSVDIVTRVIPKKKKRRPSDQALKIVASSASGDQEKQPRKRKKKNPSESPSNDNGESRFSPTCTSSKIWTPKPLNSDWVEGRKVIEDIPFALDESDNFTLETLPVPSEINAIEPPAYLKTAANVRLGRSSLRNGEVKNLDEIRRRQPSPVLSVNGSISSANEQTPKKERRGFKKLFKKVF